MSTAWIALGGNLGARASILTRAIERLQERGLIVRRRSRFYESAPEGETNEPSYLNAVAEVETELSPAALLSLLQEVELALGRPHPHAAGPRTCDLDLLAFDDLVLNEPSLVIPHPRMERRSFVLVPLCEIDPHWVHPVSRISAGDLLAALPASFTEIHPHEVNGAADAPGGGAAHGRAIAPAGSPA